MKDRGVATRAWREHGCEEERRHGTRLMGRSRVRYYKEDDETADEDETIGAVSVALPNSTSENDTHSVGAGFQS